MEKGDERVNYMKTFFKDIFDYHHQTNQKIIQLLLETEEQLSERIIYLLSHSLNAHQIWNARIIDSEKVGVHDIQQLRNCAKMDEVNYETTVGVLDHYDLNKMIKYKNSKGEEFENSIQQVLFHISNHFSHHRGQIAMALREQNIQPSATDYIFYKR